MPRPSFTSSPSRKQSPPLAAAGRPALAVVTVLGLLLAPALSGCPPKEPPPPRHPTTLPPQNPSTAPRCKAGLYLRGGRWVWAKGAWKWQKPRCAPKPAHWHDGCVWQQGRWRRTEGKLRFTPGQLVCRPRQSDSRAAPGTQPPPAPAPPARRGATPVPPTPER
jgi:hypothetical protein